MAERVINAFDLLENPWKDRLPAVVAIVGEDRFLKQQVVQHLQPDDPDAQFDRMDSDREWRDVMDELSTVSLFSTTARSALIVDADDL